MIVDDNKDAADTCEMLLTLLGHEVQTLIPAEASRRLPKPSALMFFFLISVCRISVATNLQSRSDAPRGARAPYSLQ